MAEQRRLASTEWVDIVNEDNEVIAQASREQMRAQCLRHRATYIVVHDGMGKILVPASYRDKRLSTRHATMRPPAAWSRPTSNCPGIRAPRGGRRARHCRRPLCRPRASSHYEDKHCRVWGAPVQLAHSQHGPVRPAGRRSQRSVLADAGRDHRPRCDEFTPDSLKALALWMKRNAKMKP